MDKDLQKEYERIQRYAAKSVSRKNIGHYDLYADEVNAIYKCSPHEYDMIILAFSFGFEKGCRATQKQLAI